MAGLVAVLVGGVLMVGAGQCYGSSRSACDALEAPWVAHRGWPVAAVPWLGALLTVGLVAGGARADK